MAEREPLKLTDRSMGIWRRVHPTSLSEFRFMDELKDTLAEDQYVGRPLGGLALSLVERGQYESGLAHNPGLLSLDPVSAARSVLYPEPFGVTDPLDVEVMGVDYFGYGDTRSIGLTIADPDGSLTIARQAYEERLYGNDISRPQQPFRPHISIGHVPEWNASRKALRLARTSMPKRLRLAPATSHPTLEDLQQLFPAFPDGLASQ
jgi:hypothetical protein